MKSQTKRDNDDVTARAVRGTRPESTVQRLSAILIADVVDYSLHMRRNESDTHRRVREMRDEKIEPRILDCFGRIVHRAGDGTLAEFHSATHALCAAIGIQRRIKERNRGLSKRERIMLRIGITVGEVLVDGDEIAGCEVNLAARLQAVAKPGGINVSRALRELLRKDQNVRFRDAGLHRLKNMGWVNVFRVDVSAQPAKAKFFSSVSGRIALVSGRLSTFFTALFREGPRRALGETGQHVARPIETQRGAIA
jgi:class 3 adenylate cyclase